MFHSLFLFRRQSPAQQVGSQTRDDLAGQLGPACGSHSFDFHTRRLRKRMAVLGVHGLTFIFLSTFMRILCGRLTTDSSRPESSEMAPRRSLRCVGRGVQVQADTTAPFAVRARLGWPTAFELWLRAWPPSCATCSSVERCDSAREMVTARGLSYSGVLHAARRLWGTLPAEHPPVVHAGAFRTFPA